MTFPAVSTVLLAVFLFAGRREPSRESGWPLPRAVALDLPAGLLEGGAAGRTLRRFELGGLRTPRYAYVEHEGGEKELYDMEEDPHQIDNLYESADASLLNALHSRLEALEECAGTKCREAENRRIP